MNEIRTLLTDLAGNPPADLDLDRLMARGRTRARFRGLGAGALAAALVAGTVGTALAVAPGSDPPVQPLSSPTARATVVRGGADGTPPPGVQVHKPRSTDLSKALGAQVRALAPEYGSARYLPSDGQYEDERGRVTRWLVTGFSVTAPKAPSERRPVFELMVAAPGVPAGARPLDVICTSMIPAEGPCVGSPRRLTDGSHARVYSRVVEGTRRYAVLIVKPDGTRIVVDGGIMWTTEITSLPDLGPDRLIEIGQQVTVRP